MRTDANVSETNAHESTEGVPTLKFRVKVPATLEQAAKLRNWLERQRHKTPRPAQNYLSNIVAQCKSIRDEHDLKRVQPMIAWQAERLDLARQQQREG